MLNQFNSFFSEFQGFNYEWFEDSQEIIGEDYLKTVRTKTWMLSLRKEWSIVGWFERES